MALCEPIFLGFLPKKIVRCPDWLKVPHIKQICSVSQCVSARPPGMFSADSKWNYNRAGLYDNLDSVFDDVPPDERDQYDIFAYKAYNIQIDGSGVHEIDILEHLPMQSHGINPDPDLSCFRRIGYDIIQEIGGLSFGCSPLSCNHLAVEFKVNEFCLIDNLEYAIEAGTKFEEIGAEPPPYYVFEVYRKNC